MVIGPQISGVRDERAGERKLMAAMNYRTQDGLADFGFSIPSRSW
jgi:hypothetical protein